MDDNSWQISSLALDWLSSQIISSLLNKLTADIFRKFIPNKFIYLEWQCLQSRGIVEFLFQNKIIIHKTPWEKD